MNADNKICQLQAIIKQQLVSKIDRDFVLLDTPCHQNVGDFLIWQGELDFLKQCRHKCLYSGSLYDSFFSVPDDALILFQGGGNFGDIWPTHNEYRKKVINEYPNNPIIILPQSVCYLDQSKLSDDASFYSKHRNVTICVRDMASKEILESNFKNDILLVPDMAFMMNLRRYKCKVEVENAVLFCKRDDKESVPTISYNNVPANAHVSDWLSPTNKGLERESYWAHRIANSIDIRIGTSIYPKVNNWFWKYRYKDAMIQYAIDFVSPYGKIYTTRLHVAILSILLGKTNIVLFDNSYGKLSSYLSTWLDDLDGIELIK